MERVAVFVDAGYFWVQISRILYGEIRSREQIGIKEREMRECLIKEVERQFPGASLLRVYWYDGLGWDNRPTPQHKSLACLDDIKMRYGTININRQQKEVDGLIMADLLSLAQNKAINSALLISGDADLTPGVNAAQILGVRIHRLEISGPEASSPKLSEEVDKNILWDINEVRSFIYEPPSQPGLVASEDSSGIPMVPTLPDGQSGGRLNEIANEFVDGLTPQEKEEIRVKFSIPREIDRKLLRQAKSALDRFLDEGEKIALRSAVQNIVHGRK